MKKDCYEYWDRVLAKNEKVVREKHRRVIFDIFPSQSQLNRLYKKGKLTEAQYEDLTARTTLYVSIRYIGYNAVKEEYKDNKYFQKYYYEAKMANGKTFSEIFDN